MLRRIERSVLEFCRNSLIVQIIIIINDKEQNVLSK